MVIRGKNNIIVIYIKVNYIFGPYLLHHISIWFSNLSIVLIWSLTFQFHVNFVIVVISWMEIDVAKIKNYFITTSTKLIF